MRRVSVASEGRFALSRLWGTAFLALLLTLVLAIPQAEASRRKRQKAAPYSPPYASMVFDVNTGRTLQATNPDAPRHPASVTKVMTLYMLFEQIERGRFTLNSELPVSRFAASQKPSKLNLAPGTTISVEDAIKALITKSANDVAVVVAEAIGGTEERFGQMMTAKARSIGMTRSTFRNAPACRTRSRSPPRVISSRWGAPSMTASRNSIPISARAPSSSTATPIATTTSFSAASRVWMASRPASRAPRASTC